MGALDGKVVWITGASSGIGEALAREFARQGAILVLSARRTDRLEALARELSPDGARALAFPCDVTRDGDCEAAVKRAVEVFGRLDVAVANAGFGVVGSVSRLELEDYRRQLETNLFGVLRTVKAAIPELKRTKGRIAVMGSVNGYVALEGNSPYGVSKFAVRALCDSLRFELAHFGISVTHIAPGFVESEIRQVDNQGRHNGSARDPVPAWLVCPTAPAARAMVKAIVARRGERVVTGHGQAAVFMVRHFPRLFRFILTKLNIHARREAH